FITFLVTGLWHGAGWTFVIMGALHGLYLVFGLVTKKWREVVLKATGLFYAPKLHKFIQTIFTFSLVSFSWIFFRSSNLSIAFKFIRQIFVRWNLSPLYIMNIFYYPFNALGFSQSDLLISLGGILIILITEHIQNIKPLGLVFNSQPIWIRSMVYSALVISIVVFSVYSTEQFIYFQF
nr:MBOAT family protein [Patescibacteria group bacterium]